MEELLELLLLLMSVLSKSLLALVRRHLMSLSFLTAWHSIVIYFVFNSLIIRSTPIRTVESGA